MKEIKEFIQELCDCAKPSATHRDGIGKDIVIDSVICLDLEILHLSGRKV